MTPEDVYALIASPLSPRMCIEAIRAFGDLQLLRGREEMREEAGMLALGWARSAKPDDAYGIALAISLLPLEKRPPPSISPKEEEP